MTISKNINTDIIVCYKLHYYEYKMISNKSNTREISGYRNVCAKPKKSGKGILGVSII